MSHTRVSHPTDSADCWLAFRYLTGDLNDAEWAAFENRLAEDANLQIALAESVQLVSGLSQIDVPEVFSSSVVAPDTLPAQQRFQRPRRRMAGLAAAVLSVVALGLLLQPSSSVQVGSTSTEEIKLSGNDGYLRRIAAVDVPAVVSLWSALARDEFADADQFVSVDAGSANDGMSDVLDVPHWLLLAVYEDPDDDAIEFREGESL